MLLADLGVSGAQRPILSISHTFSSKSARIGRRAQLTGRRPRLRKILGPPLSAIIANAFVTSLTSRNYSNQYCHKSYWLQE